MWIYSVGGGASVFFSFLDEVVLFLVVGVFFLFRTWNGSASFLLLVMLIFGKFANYYLV